MITFIVTEYKDNRLSMLGLNLLGVTAIAGIIAVIIGYKIFIIAQRTSTSLSNIFSNLDMQLLQKLAYTGLCLEPAQELLT
ncbi:hypothetical protein [uncultured Coprobacter sp.]|uniref:hypothetical protein n=1 Tax=uncultured Coprobacter sp. TaxID=1720550 RepID=UPI0025CF7061|nr:hypothetical protein [uncultured Coprobacter sp.]